MLMSLQTNYYLQSRQDILNLIPLNANLFLEFGCGFGALGQAIKARQKCELHGIELNPNAAPHLEKIYDRYWISDIESFQTYHLDDKYDCIIFPDVLEHLVDPWSVIKEAKKHLNENGQVIASIPNIKNFAILYRLIAKDSWHYESAGILDKTHLRFFTRSTIIEMFNDAGLTVEEIRVNKDNHKGFKRLVSAFLGLCFKDINVCQYLLKARITHA